MSSLLGSWRLPAVYTSCHGGMAPAQGNTLHAPYAGHAVALRHGAFRCAARGMHSHGRVIHVSWRQAACAGHAIATWRQHGALCHPGIMWQGGVQGSMCIRDVKGMAAAAWLMQDMPWRHGVHRVMAARCMAHAPAWHHARRHGACAMQGMAAWLIVACPERGSLAHKSARPPQ